jgi:translation initiation factor IF-3
VGCAPGGGLSIDKATRINEGVRVREVRLIDAEGTQLGVVLIEQALRLAKEQGFDLVEVAPTAKPPVCRIMDFGKFLYQQKKKAQESRKKQKVFVVKEVKFRPNIDDHDYGFKLRNAVRFLEEGDKVKATVQFRGREMARTDLGYNLLTRVAKDIGEQGIVESTPEMAGNRMHLIIGPGKIKSKKAPATAAAPESAAAAESSHKDG